MEEGIVQGLHGQEKVPPRDIEEEGSDTFNHGGVEKHGFQKYGDVPYRDLGEGILNDPPITNAYGPSQEEVKEHGKSHDPQSPHLDEDQNDHLPALRKEATRIHHN